MARTSKVCHSATCGGAKQPCELRFEPADPQQPSDVARWVVRCKSCGSDHPPDADFVVRDGRAWARDHKNAHGEIPIPLQETP